MVSHPRITVGDFTIYNDPLRDPRAFERRNVPDYALVGGVPARPIQYRLPEASGRKLLELAWWDWPVERIAAHMNAIRGGDLAALRRGGGGYTSCP